MHAIYIIHCNFWRANLPFKVTPELEGNMANHVWTILDGVALLDRAERCAAC